LPRLIITIVILSVVSLSVLFITRKIVKNINEVPSISKVYEYWNNQDYQKVYETCDIILKSKPYNSTVMAYKGYAAFCLSISQSDLELSHEYIDSAINSLRLSLIEAPEALYPQICYMLGKSYFYKNSISAYYYYADSAVYYLNEALKFGFSASDISRYLGLSYAQLSMTEESIKSFSEALLTDENDNLLLAIAEQYIKNGQSENAKQYLFRIRSISNDEIMILKACEYLASIYVEEGNYNEALSEYNSILEKDPYNADVYYGIGVIYEKMGDMAKARAEWRKALKVQVNHAGALKKLS
jgi:tetratricopeptide (TPR) repeat protein